MHDSGVGSLPAAWLDFLRGEIFGEPLFDFAHEESRSIGPAKQSPSFGVSWRPRSMGAKGVGLGAG